MTTTRVDNDNLHPLLLKLLYAIPGDDDRVRLGVRAEIGDLGLSRVLLQLVEGTRTESVGANETRFEALAGVVGSKLR